MKYSLPSRTARVSAGVWLILINLACGVAPESKQPPQELPRAQRAEAASSFVQGTMLAEKGKLEQALQSFDQALKSDPNYLPLQIAKADVLCQLGRADEGVQLLEAAQKSGSRSAEISSLLALGYFKKKEAAKARHSLDDALKQAPKESSQSSAYYLKLGERLGNLMLELDHPSPTIISRRLLPLFEKAAALDPRNARLQFQVAELAVHAEDNAKAAVFYEKTYALARSFPDIQSRLAAALIASHQEKKAVEVLEQMLEDKTVENKKMYPVLAALYENLENFEKAEDYCLLNVKLGEPDANDYVNLARVQLLNKKPEKAAETLLDAQRAFPTEPRLPFMRGIALRVAKKNQESRTAFELAEKIGADAKDFLNSNFYFEYGSTCERAGDAAAAEKYFQKALTLEPNNHMAMNYLGYMWAEQNQKLDEAEKLLQRALKFDPEAAAYQDSLAWIYYRQGRFREARDLLLLAVKKMDKDPTVQDHLGDVYLKLRNKARAVQHWEKALAATEDASEKKKIEEKIVAHAKKK
ncbi:MAG: tetratricopeptide repeat protein [bacterium]